MCRMHWLIVHIHIYSELIVQWHLLFSHREPLQRMKTNEAVPAWVILLERRISLLCCGVELIPVVLISSLAFKNLQQAVLFTFDSEVKFWLFKTMTKCMNITFSYWFNDLIHAFIQYPDLPIFFFQTILLWNTFYSKYCHMYCHTP